MKLALTFDDGPSQWTGPVLQLLHEHDARATFFLIGQRVRERPDDVRRIVEAGHEIGSHTMTHPRLTEIGDDEIRREIQDGARAVAEVVGERPHLFPGARVPRRRARLQDRGGAEARHGVG